MPPRTPPRFVPTLTEVVQSAAPAVPVAGGGPPPASVALDEQLVRRVMQHLEHSLDLQLREAIATVVLEHTRAIGPAVREEIERLVRRQLAQALAEEQRRAARP